MCYSDPCCSLGTGESNIFYLNPSLPRLRRSFEPSTGRSRVYNQSTSVNIKLRVIHNIQPSKVFIKCGCPDLNRFDTI